MSIDMNLIFNLLLLILKVVSRCIKINAERKQSHVSELLEKQKSIIKVEEALTNFSRLASKSYRYEGLELRQKIPKHVEDCRVAINNVNVTTPQEYELTEQLLQRMDDLEDYCKQLFNLFDDHPGIGESICQDFEDFVAPLINLYMEGVIYKKESLQSEINKNSK